MSNICSGYVVLNLINFCSIIRRTTVRNLRIREDTAKVCDSTICCVSMFLLLWLFKNFKLV